jgi:hypothetical protein
MLLLFEIFIGDVIIVELRFSVCTYVKIDKLREE